MLEEELEELELLEELEELLEELLELLEELDEEEELEEELEDRLRLFLRRAFLLASCAFVSTLFFPPPPFGSGLLPTTLVLLKLYFKVMNFFYSLFFFPPSLGLRKENFAQVMERMFHLLDDSSKKINQVDCVLIP